jgi:hypothetical protein
MSVLMGEPGGARAQCRYAEADQGHRRGAKKIGDRIKEGAGIVSRPPQEEVAVDVSFGVLSYLVCHLPQRRQRIDPQRRPERNAGCQRQEGPERARDQAGDQKRARRAGYCVRV